MKDAMTKFILTIGGVILGLLVLAFMFFGYNTLKGNGNKTLSKANDTTNSMLNSNITDYNRDNIPGSEVINAITTFMDSSEEIYVKVENVYYIYPSGTVTPDGREKKSETMDKISEAKKKGSATYIGPQSKYKGKVIYMDDDETIIEGIEFTLMN